MFICNTYNLVSVAMFLSITLALFVLFVNKYLYAMTMSFHLGIQYIHQDLVVQSLYAKSRYPKSIPVFTRSWIFYKGFDAGYVD